MRGLAGVFPGLGVLVLSGCLATVGPDYAPPALETGPTYRAPVPASSATTPAEAWWEGFGDPVLTALIVEGLKNNLDIQLADARVSEAAAALSAAGSDRLPTFDGQGKATVESDRKLSAPPATADNKVSPTGSTVIAGIFSWTADLFGGLTRSEEAARADMERLAWIKRDTALTVAADIARAYMVLRGAERRLALTRESLELQRQTLDIVASRVDAGLAPGLDLSRAESSVRALEADLRPIETQISQTRDTLATLLGRRPDELGGLVPEDGAVIPIAGAGPVIGEPADLLRRRPDLRAAERDLMRATAEIGVAEAALYPSLTIPGRLQITTGDFGTASIVHTVLANVGATLDVPLLDAGGREADLDAAEQRARQTLLTYRATLLTALSEVEAALHAHAGAARRVAALEEAAAADERAYDQARTLYAQGLTSFLDILDAQRTLTTTRQRLAVTRTDMAIAAIDLFQAVGLAPDV